ncbi:MAG: hypothetical protein A2V72_01930 [Candidatus Nealsonbacteria bacterium RBG_13_37_56]|uniref:Methyltransferase domain-containing protein n=1 Tax=Candidatus Nealsonbacteria bacterium RBG_13_37_56 TaxID=1801661 RepID=A0A1G2DXQ9_9BACT|nr:MAG: hypothetical protein A2V72_01930 [Candidatus Nealsonbacteria bacterium RBG_13_37_56]
MKICRICKKEKAQKVGEYDSYEVFDCFNCGCRFVFREKQIFDLYHKDPNSSYSFQRSLADKAYDCYKNKNLKELKKILFKSPKFKYIIKNIKDKDKNNKILEVGCSYGYLTAYFLLSGFNIIGVDISQEAVRNSINNFGNHFQTELSGLGKFDIIYHTGTIGCVDDPITFTNKLLAMLNPGGELLFNAPDKKALIKNIWINTFPPDLITWFDNNFWFKFFPGNLKIKINQNFFRRPFGSFVKISKL